MVIQTNHLNSGGILQAIRNNINSISDEKSRREFAESCINEHYRYGFITISEKEMLTKEFL